MATESGGAAAPLVEELFAAGHSFEFFQAVRILESLAAGGQRLGGDTDPAEEPLRLRSSVGLSFPTSTVRKIEEPREDQTAPSLTASFFGVATPASFGSLPTCYAELVLARQRDHDPALREFLDLFNHRLLSLFYRAWEKHRFDLVYERSGAREGGDFERGLFALLGLGTGGLRDRLPFADIGLLRWSGALSRGCASAQELEDLVGEQFGVPVTVEQFVAGWYESDPTERINLGGRDARLGRDTYLGETVRVAQFRFRLCFGPLGWDEYQRFLPVGDAYGPLRELVRLATGPEFDCDVKLVLRAEDAFPLQLGGERRTDFRLGWTTWLFTRPLTSDPSHVVRAPAFRSGGATPS